ITRLFGTPWCSDCKLSKSFLAEHLIDYKYIDIADDEEAAKFVKGESKGEKNLLALHFFL
ncbi:unnamed protein product, partial [marine sediment metagenome]